MTKSTTVTSYIAAQPPVSRAVLRTVRATLRKALPGAEERIGYGIPCYRIDERNVIYLAGWKEHWSLYPLTPALVAALRAELTRYAMSKGTIRFPFERRVPVALVTRIAKFRAREESERSGALAAKKTVPISARKRSAAR